MQRLDTPVLNPDLHARLVARFGDARVTRPGLEARFVPQTNPRTGRERLEVDPLARGQQFEFCCPFCQDQGAARGDTRFRASASYLFGQPHPETGEPMTWLCYCQNETHCLPGRGGELHAMLTDRLTPAQRQLAEEAARNAASAMRSRYARTAEPFPLDLPADAVPVADLPEGHQARRYLAGRGFDPWWLSRYYDVRFCTGATTRHRYVRGRLVFPIASDGRHAGYQTRVPADLPWKEMKVPKYWFPPGVPRAGLLYSADLAAGGDVLVLVEGVTDAWRVGPQAVATFGSEVSPRQRQLAGALAAGRPVVWLRDSNIGEQVRSRPAYALADAERRRRLADAVGGRLAVVDLPEGDPGSWARDDLWALIRRELAAGGLAS